MIPIQDKLISVEINERISLYSQYFLIALYFSSFMLLDNKHFNIGSGFNSYLFSTTESDNAKSNKKIRIHISFK